MSIKPLHKQLRIDTNPHIVEMYLKPNKNFPNNKLPVLIYRKVFILPKQKTKAGLIIQKTFLRSGWGNTWTNGIYDFHHYHSNAHECLGIAMGTASLICGGPNGKHIKVACGDVLILPAGTGHKCSKASDDFICVGGYPQSKNYDINHGTPEELKKALPRIRKLSIPSKDPLFGNEGFLRSYWK